ncbi:MAG: CDP-alcohol phosphatidyltransferase family protein [Dactylosporangium sp.]|nr:CDP-alcohol phosphatidyltransferase family protein [Dactylosporangium sp.]NNJ60111.1 CDP-alcohol phosphatidyltransferase family protein [Dactylosporangium sp.]
MAKILSVVSRAGLARILDPIAQTALRAGISPNAVTIAGTIGVLIGAIGFGARGSIIAAVIIVTISAFTDLVDGAMARALGRNGRFGALLDSTMDRVADAAIFGALTYWFATTGHPRAAVAALLCLATGQVVSYVKARAEGLGFTCNVGLAERAERLILVGVGAVLHLLSVPHGFEVVLWLLAALSLVTIGQRMRHVYRCDQAACRERAAADAGQIVAEAGRTGGGRR